MFKIDPNMTKIHPKMLKIRQIAPQKIQNVNKLLQKFYSRQKTRELPSKSYCWTSNVLGTSCLGAAIAVMTYISLLAEVAVVTIDSNASTSCNDRNGCNGCNGHTNCDGHNGCDG